MAYYPTIRGVDKPLEFAGVKGQYIYIAGGVIVFLFIIAVFLSNTSVNVFLTILVVGSLLFGAISGLVYISQHYGVHGLMKLQVRYLLPCFVRNTHKSTEIILNHKQNEEYLKRN